MTHPICYLRIHTQSCCLKTSGTSRPRLVGDQSGGERKEKGHRDHPSHRLQGASQHLYKPGTWTPAHAVNSDNGHAQLKLLLQIGSIHCISLSNCCLQKRSKGFCFQCTYDYLGKKDRLPPRHAEAYIQLEGKVFV